MKTTEILVIGGGPAGLSAAISAGSRGAKVILLERDDFLGGQLIKQTHRFFGSKREHAGTRGFKIAEDLKDRIKKLHNVEVMVSARALGFYEDGVVTVLKDEKMHKIKAEKVIVATGAHEKFLPFINNDLPGIYGAGAVQTLMNVYGIVPAQRILMVGAGNIGLIVSYQLMQAGVEVAAIIEAAPRIGGYLVHASKVRRMGVPILTRHTIKAAYGTNRVEKAVICQLDDKWQHIPGTEQELEVDTICLAVGLSPLTEILWQAECEMIFVPELGGHVPLRDENLETSVPGIYVAGDCAGVEEATAAMLEGELAGLSAAYSLGYGEADFKERREQIVTNLQNLRSGPVGDKIRAGLAKVRRGA
ncbi:pyridine nucleotide-disulfide oxidoreductase [Anoxybacter fermentans]|uniref:Pyridine nucleotide-disulfide oxidoreductase n=1 Tax=Anoxybacter fermentans TaxID=1323375 RepID=A0A3S9SW59_9FIRM|nr:NAD(P)/FAD-dependent oxidoreductase [Anoxybacter fermentans]AZR72470.1 pyridine nucleotide-disulfide oxidoreductase [Anoxybacter fermentans]